MGGDAELALRLGRPTVTRIQASTAASPFGQLMGGLAYAALGTLAPPAEVLALPEPKLPYVVAAWHYARGETFSRQGRTASVRAEAAAIVAAPSSLADDDAGRAARQMSFVARNVLLGRAAMMERQFGQAAILFRQAAEMQEDAHFSDYTDPPAWYYPVRRDLAAALLAAGETVSSRREAEATLAYRPRDPGALAILARTGAGTRPASEPAR